MNLLGGLIKASAVKADVYGSYDGVTHRFSDYSTGTNLVVNGKPITASAGSVITVSGVGTLYVHRVIRSTRSYTVRMLELVVTMPNSFNLAVGTDVQAGVAAVAFRD